MTRRTVPAGVILLFFALAAGLGYWLVSSLGTLIPAAVDRFVPDAETARTLGDIFGQLTEAAVTPHVLLPVVLASGFALLRFLLPPKHGFVTALYVLLGIVLWLAAFLSAVLFARINGIRIFDIASVLTDLIRGGLLEIL
ncbi:MAG: hypothetical protein IJD06_00060 [Clostridia bacterium]|nr:hypothetical protein [Clostridia bacterium]